MADTFALSQPPTYAKAVYAVIVTPLAQLATLLVGDVGFGEITVGQWVAITLATVLAGGGVFGLENQPVRNDT